MSLTMIPMTPDAKLLGAEQDGLYLIDFDAFPILLDARHVRFSSMNSLAREALPDLLRSGLEAASVRLAGRFRVDPALVRRDLTGLRDELERQGFLPGAGRRRTTPAGALARAVGKRLIRLALASRTRRYLRCATGPALGRRREAELRRMVRGLLPWAWLSLRRRGWSDTLALWQSSAGRAVPPVAHVEGVVALLDRVVRDEAAGQLFFPCACKERALVAGYCLRRLFGLAADVVFGVIPVPFQAHAWAACQEWVLTDDPERIRRFRPVMRFPFA